MITDPLHLVLELLYLVQDLGGIRRTLVLYLSHLSPTATILYIPYNIFQGQADPIQLLLNDMVEFLFPLHIRVLYVV